LVLTRQKALTTRWPTHPEEYVAYPADVLYREDSPGRKEAEREEKLAFNHSDERKDAKSEPSSGRKFDLQNCSFFPSLQNLRVFAPKVFNFHPSP